ncbi:diguanylate cyclase domain-containing protein [Jiella pacifica]|uniref:Diguanylate cyclase n=1 Tax=Jiella pacifica TaxID=2696469 RepID=A0A6N9TBT8_9HYPH|nr:diguanylate cyclase [Jiella pacifica]NDW07695.1 diguanylate cyclase [Jiella pacifica]
MIAAIVTRHLPILFVLPALLILIVTGCLVAATVYWSASKTDIASVDRETRLVRRLVDDRIARITRDQLTSTTWDEAVKGLSAPVDSDWLDDNLGVWMHDYFGIDRVFILDGTDHSLYAMIDGKRRRPDAYFSHASLIEPIVKELRQFMASPAAASSGSPFFRRYILLENRPAVVSIAPILPETADGRPLTGSEPVHIAINFLDAAFLTELGEDFMILRPRFSWTGTIGAHEAAFPLSSARGDLGFLVWTVQQPGKEIVSQLAPTLMIAGGTILLLAGLLLLHLYRTTVRLLRSQAHIEHMAHHDPLTDLANRFSFEDYLERRAREFERTGRSFAVLYLDLDRFKAVNDTLGHLAGDELIRQVAERLQTTVQRNDLVARLGGDEFAVLRDFAPDRTDVERLAEAILMAIEHPFVLMQQHVVIGISIGAAIATEGAANQTDLVRRADVALYRVKNSGRNGFLLFEEGMNRRGAEGASRIAG